MFFFVMERFSQYGLRWWDLKTKHVLMQPGGVPAGLTASNQVLLDIMIWYDLVSCFDSDRLTETGGGCSCIEMDRRRCLIFLERDSLV